MKILMMTNTYLPIVGGLEKSIKTFTEEFRRAGHKVMIAAPEDKNAPEYEPNIVRLPAIQKFNKTDFSLNIPIPGMLEKLFESYRPDIVHAHHPFLVGDLALRLCGQYDIPLVFTYHTMFEQYTDYFALDNEGFQTFVMKLAAGYANLSDYVIAPSASVRRILRKRGVKQPIHVVPTGFDVKKFKKGDGGKIRKKLRIPEDAFLAGHIGRLSEEKNLGFLTDAAAIFLAHHPAAYFLVGGRGDQKQEMMNTFKKCGVYDRVRFAGVLHGQSLINAYHAMDVFLFSSLSETQGMVVTEAMSAGVPVIGLDAPGVREAIDHGENGFLVSPEHLALYFKAMNDFYMLPAHVKQKFSVAACEKAQFFSSENCARKALRVYRTAIKNNRNKKLDQMPWKILMNRLKTEWEMLTNLSQAAGLALKESLLQAEE